MSRLRSLLISVSRHHHYSHILFWVSYSGFLQQVHHSQLFHTPPHNHYSTSPMHLPCCCFFSLCLLACASTPPCLIFTAPIPPSQLTFQTHGLSLSCFSLLTCIHNTPNSHPKQRTSPAKPESESLQVASCISPIQRSFLGHSVRHFTHMYFSKPPFLLLLKSLRRTCAPEQWSFLAPVSSVPLIPSHSHRELL